MQDHERVVVTGLAPVAPNGTDRITFWESLVKGISPIKKIERFSDPKLGFNSQIGAEFENFTPEPFLPNKEFKRIGRCAAFAAVAAKKVLADAHFAIDENNQHHVGVVMGTGIGGVEIFEKQQKDFLEGGIKKINPLAAAAISPHASAAEISILLGAKGLNFTVTTGCSSGLNAVINAYNLLKQGQAGWIIAGGTEAPLSDLTFATFDASGQLAAKECLPFDLHRKGFVLAEGAAVVLLERLDLAKKRNAHIYAEIVGGGSSSDAYNFYKLDEEGTSAAESIQQALNNAKLAPEEVDCVFAHGSGSKSGDLKETMALKRVFGTHIRRMPITSIKATMGMPFGASGVFQLITSCLAIENKLIPFIKNYKTPDPMLDLDFVAGESRTVAAETVLLNSFGLGGNNAALLAKKI